MSWICSIPEVPVAELHDAIDAAVPSPPEIGGAVLAQFEAAKLAAHALAEANVVGQGQLPVTMELCGHSDLDPAKPSIVSVTVMELAPTLAQGLVDPPAQDAVVHDENGEPLPEEETVSDGHEAEASAETELEPVEAATEGA